MNRFLCGLACFVPVLAVDISPTSARSADPLPSWNQGAAKTALLDYVDRVTDTSGPDFVPEAERIAVFDNDGTLWPENPLPFQLAYAMDRLRQLVAEQPDLKDDPVVQAALQGDLETLVAGPRYEGLVHIMDLTHAGITTEEFRNRVTRWMGTARHPRFDRRYDQLAYQPMLELLAYLRAHGFRTWIVSGGGVDFMRAFAERVYGIPPEQIVGSTALTVYELRDDGPVLVKTMEDVFVDDKGGKPAGIHQFIGRRPIACFGNSDGDKEMLEYTTIGNPHPALGLIVHHTDSEREYAYDSKPQSSGKLARALQDAPSRGWIVVDMQQDWNRVFTSD